MKRILILLCALNFLLGPGSLCGELQRNAQVAVPEILLNSAVVSRAEELRRDVDVLNVFPCKGDYSYLEPPARVGDFIGGRVNVIRVVRFVGINLPAQSDPSAILKKVWNGQFRSASCSVDWDEMTFWSIEAVVEFEDGKRGKLITDGSHVVLQDHAGKNWFIRLLPAAQ